MRRFIVSLISLITITACQKQAELTRDVQFTSTTYQSLNSYDSTGLPGNLLKDTISADLISFCNNTLPEGKDLRKSSPELLGSKAIADIAITEQSNVFITYISNGASASNAFGFYTYPTNNPPTSPDQIKTITYIFQNAGAGTRLMPGDKVKLGSFGAGTSIGFVLLYGGWDPVKKQLNNKAVHYLSNDALNPEVDPNLKKHAVLINYPKENKTVIGFEDLNRAVGGSDNDFNDLLVYATVLK